MNKYLMFDGRLINGYKVRNTKISLEHLIKENKVLFKEDFFSEDSRKWEVRYDNAYPNVIYDKKYKKYRVYYTLFTKDTESENTSLEERRDKQYVPNYSRITSVCYAESDDGVNWIKPNLGLVEFNGKKDNNILMKHAHGTGVFLDEDELDENKRYKLVTKIEYTNTHHYMAIAFSKDGIHFSKPIEWPNYNPEADTHNFPFKDKKTGKYVVITRAWSDGIRIVVKFESTDFINWSEGVEIARGDGLYNQIYSMPVFQYEDYYLGIPSIYHEGDTTLKDYDLVDCRLMYSTKLTGWGKIGGDENFIERGNGKYPNGDFDCGCIYASAPIEIDDKLYFYYMGGNGQHTNYRETSFARGYIEKDKFTYCEQRDKTTDSELITRPMYVYGGELKLLCNIKDGGEVKIEVARINGSSYEGFSYEDCIVDYDGKYAKISFKDRSLSELIGENIELKIKFIATKIYSLECELVNTRK